MPSWPATASTPRGMRVLEAFPPAQPKIEHRVAVLGAVSRPGLFLLEGDPVSIGQLAESAGLTVTGRRPLVRVFRNGRPYYGSLDIGDLATAGDVIVFGPVPLRAVSESSGSTSFGVALLGLADHPVLISVPGDSPSLSRLLQELRQPEAVLRSARTWPIQGTPLRGEAPLSEGAVVQLDPLHVDPAAALASGLVVPASPQGIPESQPEAAHLMAEAFPPPLERTAALPALPGIWESPNSTETGQASLISGSFDKRSGEPQEGSAPFDTASEVAAPEPPLLPSRRLAPKSRGAAVELAYTGSREAATSSDSTLLGVATTTLLSLAALGGLGVLIVWLRREVGRRRGRSQAFASTIPAPASETCPAPADAFLADLVRDRLPIVEEPLVLPERLDLHGRSVGQSRLVIHPAQPIAGPHFVTAPSGNIQKTVRNGVSSNGPPKDQERDSGPARRSSRSAAPAEEGLLERVLMAMHREERR